jgi:hypothetical protein
MNYNFNWPPINKMSNLFQSGNQPQLNESNPFEIPNNDYDKYVCGRVVDLDKNCRFFSSTHNKFCGKECINGSNYCSIHDEIDKYKKSPDDVVMSGQRPDSGFY